MTNLAVINVEPLP